MSGHGKFRGGGGFPGRGGGRGGGRGDGRGGRGGGGGGYGGRGGGGGGRGGGAPAVYQLPNGASAPQPDPNVTKIENATQNSLASQLDKLSLKPIFPQRPAYGTDGRPVVLWANYVELVTNKELVLYSYAIEVKPEAVGKKLVRIVGLLLEEPDLAALRDGIVTDFKSTLLSRKRLPQDEKKWDITYRAEGEDVPTQRATRYDVRLKYTNTLSVSNLLEYLTSSTLPIGHYDKQPIVQALNIFFNHYSKTHPRLATIGASRNFPLDPRQGGYADLGSGLQAIRGFFASVRAATARILVNVNVSYGAFYKPGPLVTVIREYGTHNKYKLEKFLKRLKVSPRHIERKKNKTGEVILRKKTIFGLAFKRDGANLDHPPRVSEFGAGPRGVEFWLDQQKTPAPGKGKGAKGGKQAKPAGQSSTGGRYISVYDFFRQTYNISLKEVELPVINVGTRENPTYLPPEVCDILPGQTAGTKLSPNQTANMIGLAVRKPSANAISIVGEGISLVGLSPQTNPLLSRFGMTVKPELITVQGRVLTGPEVHYGNAATRSDNGAWNIMGKKFTKFGQAKLWGCVVMSFPGDSAAFRDANHFNDTMNQFRQVLRSTGIGIADQSFTRRWSYGSQEDPAIEANLREAAQRASLLFIVLPAANMPVYDRIKHLCDVKLGVATICSVGSKLAKNQDQYFRNVALKFNLKLGGSNQEIRNRRLPFLSEDKTMVVGIDVTHPSPGSTDKAPSVAGMVANIDKWMGQWPAVLSIQSKARQEMVSNLKDMLKSRLNLWRTKGRHPSLPENILIYRDGVSEGQYRIVHDDELPLLRAACEEMYSAAQRKAGLPRLTVVVVGKRHHTRFYPTTAEGADRSSNCAAGTVVDRGVTEARGWDFFLQAHSAIQGTARPAHYFVVHDEIFRKSASNTRAPLVQNGNVEDTLEHVTQGLCYVYGRATRAVSVCTPAYYADIVCERARRYLRDFYDPSLASDDGASTVSGAGGHAEASQMAAQVRIHDNLKDTMFYI
ncbi:hypothetical protein DL765_005053 [Monosporascus sp. GIB2]|nr:hypothetical protein DL765_005053 [Monosporascus sp. GIB2]